MTLVQCPICHANYDVPVMICTNCGYEPRGAVPTPPAPPEEQSVSGSVEPVAGGEPGPDAPPAADSVITLTGTPEEIEAQILKIEGVAHSG